MELSLTDLSASSCLNKKVSFYLLEGYFFYAIMILSYKNETYDTFVTYVKEQ